MPCPYCSTPMSGQRRVQCGSAECSRKYNADKMREYMRERRATRGRDLYDARECAVCGKTWQPVGSDATMCCSRECTNVMRYGSGPRQRHPRLTASQLRRRRLERLQIKAAAGSKGTTPWIAGWCADCGASFVKQNSMTTYCTSRCKRHAIATRRRARQHGMKVTRVSRYRIYERDDWTCHLCGYPVDRTATVPALDAPVLDHVIALARGGDHAEYNLKTAHFYCNSVKRDLFLADVA